MLKGIILRMYFWFCDFSLIKLFMIDGLIGMVMTTTLSFSKTDGCVSKFITLYKSWISLVNYLLLVAVNLILLSGVCSF